MRSFVLTVALTLIISEASAMSVEEVPNPRSSGGWVSDTAQMLSPTEELELNAMITVAEQQTRSEIAVVTVDGVDTATPKDFATKLFNHWGIGKKTANNGLLVLMVKDQRRLEMETGYGTETVLTDGWLKTMQQRDMVPRFKEGAYGEGIKDGVALSIERLTTYETTGEIVDPGDTGGGGFPGWLLYLLGGAGLLGGGAVVGRKQWRKARTCPDCGEMMTMLPEEQDDEHLTEGQQTEEAIGSMDWEYWYCDKDQTHALIGVGKMFSGFSKCAQCGNKTRSSTTNTLAYPTQQSTGTAEVISQCAHCDFYSRTIRTLPRLPKPSSSSSYSSSSSSGGSSFGGGSSGGGGAGSSW